MSIGSWEWGQNQSVTLSDTVSLGGEWSSVSWSPHEGGHRHLDKALELREVKARKMVISCTWARQGRAGRASCWRRRCRCLLTWEVIDQRPAGHSPDPLPCRARGVVWCGVVRCGMVWVGVVRCGTVQCSVGWCGVVSEERRTRCAQWCGLLDTVHQGLGGSGRGLPEAYTTTSIVCLSSFHLHVIQGESTDPVFQEFPGGREGPSTQTPASQHPVRSENPQVVRGLLRG